MFHKERSFFNKGAIGKPRRGKGRGVMASTSPGWSDTPERLGLKK